MFRKEGLRTVTESEESEGLEEESVKSQDEDMEPLPFVYVDTTEKGSEVPEEQGDDDGVEPDGEPVGRRPAPIDLPSSFAFTVSPADMKRFVGSKNSRSLVGGWSAVYLSCALSFSYNHVRRQQSRKVHSPFWLGRAQCRTGNCIRRVDPGRASCRRRPREICRCWTF